MPLKFDHRHYYQEDFFECPECGSVKEPIVENSYECSDADGNRGIWIKWIQCVECDYEQGYM